MKISLFLYLMVSFNQVSIAIVCSNITVYSKNQQSGWRFSKQLEMKG
jgi:hypothetical protein